MNDPIYDLRKDVETYNTVMGRVFSASPDNIRALLDRLDAAEGRAEYWKASHLAGNTEIERLRESLRGLLAVTSSKAPGTGLIVGAEDRHAAAIKQARAALENKHDR